MKSHFYLRCAVWILAGFSVFSSPAAAQEQGKLKFRTFGDLHLLVEGQIGDQRGFFILDTGCTLTSINEKFASSFPSAGISTESRGIGGGRASLDMYVVEAGHIRFGEFQFEGVVAALDLEPLRRLYGVELLGLVGMNWMRNHHLRIDFEAKRVLLSQEPFQPSTDDWISLTLFWSKGTPKVRVPIAEEPATFSLDTGSQSALYVPSPIFEKMMGLGQLGQEEESEAIGLSGHVKLRSATTVDGFEFLGLRYPAFQMNVFEEDHGMIGLGVLRQYSVIFDFPSDRCYLRPVTEGDAVINYNASSFLLAHFIYPGDGQPPFVGQMHEDSPLKEIGVKEGDRILRLGPKEGKDLNLLWLSKFLDKQLGAEVRIRYQRGGESFEGSFTVPCPPLGRQTTKCLFLQARGNGAGCKILTK